MEFSNVHSHSQVVYGQEGVHLKFGNFMNDAKFRNFKLGTHILYPLFYLSHAHIFIEHPKMNFYHFHLDSKV